MPDRETEVHAWPRPPALTLGLPAALRTWFSSRRSKMCLRLLLLVRPTLAASAASFLRVEASGSTPKLNSPQAASSTDVFSFFWVSVSRASFTAALASDGFFSTQLIALCSPLIRALTVYG